MLEMNSVVLNHYRILGIAGKGGMGRVYHAVDIRDNSHWAIKEDLSNDFGFQLYEEANLLKELNHPALPKTRGVLEWEDRQYMIMQFMEGDTLAAKLKEQEKYPEELVLKWFVRICDVLCYLHARPKPIVYRDLKPSNIIIDKNDCVKIIDFGIAEEYSSQGNREESSVQKGGLTKGYAAPEQYSRLFQSDVRTDIYALGATIHYLLTGKSPTKPPYEFLPVRKLSPEVSPAMEAIVKRCLQPNPDMRYETANALYQDLTHIAQKNRDMRTRKLKRILGFSVVAFAILAAVLLAGKVMRDNRQDQIDAYYSVVEAVYQAAENRQFDIAVEQAENAIRIQPDEISGYLAMGYCYMLQEQYDSCKAYISQEILDRFPDCYENYVFLELMAQVNIRSGNPQDALYYYQHWCSLNPEDPEVWIDLSRCHLQIGNQEDAQACLEKYLDCGGNPDFAEELAKQISNLQNG